MVITTGAAIHTARVGSLVAVHPAPQPGSGVFIPVILPIITLILGVVLGTGFTAYVSRPKLKAVGGGSGGTIGTQLRIMNRPGFMGLSLGETIIFGKRIISGFYKGIPVERGTANECVAHLYDKESGDIVSVLYWRPLSNPGRVVTVVDIKSGEQVDLMLFARSQADPTRYFVYKPAGTSLEPLVPPNNVMFSDTRRFFVRILYSYGRQNVEFDVKVRRGFDGNLFFESKIMGCSF